MREVPRLGPVLGQRADAVVVADDGRAFGAARPRLARRVGLRCEGRAVGTRAGQDVVFVGRVAAALDLVAALVERRCLADVVAVVQVFQVACDQAQKPAS